MRGLPVSTTLRVFCHSALVKAQNATRCRYSRGEINHRLSRVVPRADEEMRAEMG